MCVVDDEGMGTLEVRPNADELMDESNVLCYADGRLAKYHDDPIPSIRRPSCHDVVNGTCTSKNESQELCVELRPSVNEYSDTETYIPMLTAILGKKMGKQENDCVVIAALCWIQEQHNLPLKNELDGLQMLRRWCRDCYGIALLALAVRSDN